MVAELHHSPAKCKLTMNNNNNIDTASYLPPTIRPLRHLH